MKKYKRLLLMAGIVSLVIVLSGCGTGEVSAQSTGIWDRYIVYYFAEAIKALSFGNAGIGIILFTLIILVAADAFPNKEHAQDTRITTEIKSTAATI